MNRKIIGIFVIALLTISYMPMVSSEASQVPESNEIQDSNVKIFFIGGTVGWSMATNGGVPTFLAMFGIYVDTPWVELNLTKNYILVVDGKIKNLEQPCELRLYNFTGVGSPLNPLWVFFKAYTFPWNLKFMFTLIGNCESYEIQNDTSMAN
jgi:hypothetical protein